MPSSSPAVTLRPVAEGDAGTLARLETDNRERLLIGAPERSAAWFTEAGQRAAIAQERAELAAGRAVPLVIEADGEVVGRIGLSSVVRGAFQSASVGYWVAEHAGGRGVATAAVTEICDLAFGPLRLHRVQGEVQVGNEASARVLGRCGFAEYGLAPQYLRLGGQWRDCRLFQRLAGGVGGDGAAATSSASSASAADPR